MPTTKRKVLVTLTHSALEAVDRIALDRATLGAEPNRSDAIRWMIEQHLEREKKSRKKSTLTS